jgi:N-succinyldiaminopimelate aminotransferase
MNPDLQALQPYPFTRLARLLDGVVPAANLEPLTLGLGEPQHAPPEIALAALREHIDGVGRYPATKGLPELRAAIAGWLGRRFAMPGPDPDRQVLPLNGTREGLFSLLQAVLDRQQRGLVLMPNPFYQIYEGAALLGGCQPRFLNCMSENGYLPDFSAVSPDTWRDVQLLFLCSPGNPTGAVMPLATLCELVQLAREHDFVIASDECYSEIYFDEASPPPGLLQAARAAGEEDFHNCIVFHSLSKRSSLPGLRSGFAAGDADILSGFLQYRTYHGSAMPLHHQWASIAAWSDEDHVRENRQLYRAKFDAVLPLLEAVLPVDKPAGGFYLWPETPGEDSRFARELYREQNLVTLPGSFLARQADGINPGSSRLRLALVETLPRCVEAAERLRDFTRGY